MNKFDSKKHYQSRSGVLLRNKNIQYGWDFYKKYSLSFKDDPDFVLIGIKSLKQLMVKLNLCSSNRDFERNLKQRSIKFGDRWNNAKKIKKDFIFDYNKRGIYEIRKGRKYCEFLLVG